MGYKTARDKLEDNILEIEEDIVLLDERLFVDSFVGLSQDMRAIYDYDKMIEEYMNKQNCSVDDAVDYIDQGVIRWIECFKGKAPIIFEPFGGD